MAKPFTLSVFTDSQESAAADSEVGDVKDPDAQIIAFIWQGAALANSRGFQLSYFQESACLITPDVWLSIDSFYGVQYHVHWLHLLQLNISIYYQALMNFPNSLECIFLDEISKTFASNSKMLKILQNEEDAQR